MTLPDSSVDRSQILYMMHLALIEIRATQHLRTAQAIADVLHNVPLQLMNNLPNEAILESIDVRADRLSVRKYVDVWKEASEKFTSHS